VYIRLDPDSSHPSMTVAHAVVGTLRHFGPYLGGDRVRLAVSALQRVFPLAHAGDGLTAFERALARTRGIVPADRPRLVDALMCVLDRRPDAVMGHKARARCST
jgi:excinuclease ABC subunit C